MTSRLPRRERAVVTRRTRSLGGCRVVVVRKRRLQAEHSVTPCGAPRLIGRRDSWSPPRVCRPRSEYVSRGTRPAVTCTLVLERPQSVPDGPRLVPIQGCGRPDHLRRKALSLRSRLSSYFQDPASPAPAHGSDGGAAAFCRMDRRRERRRGHHARVQPDQGAPAAFQHPPRGRQELSVPCGHCRRRSGPGATVMRGAKRKDARYFGPYAHAYAIRETLDLLLRSFPVRTCSDAKLRRHQLLGRPCLL